MILIAFVLLFGFSSCISESIFDPTPTPYDGEERTISLRLVQSEATTRGVLRPVCDGEPVQFNVDYFCCRQNSKTRPFRH